MLLYRDSGEGLPIDRLRQAAVRRSALHESQVSNLDAAAMIFTDGVSTAAQVTQISGRGAGMASARSFLQEIGGRVSIQLADKENQYGKFNFALIIEIPPACVVKLAANPHRDNIWSSHRS
jgi:chemotaxis protein histidine kinase CheA